ncbi:metallophosphoesterase [Pseudomonas sp.]|uniref:metallophosphoesterase n=1 Tax=Pseudomonas sp. TaxID=306 RepID=UPI003FD88175
MIKHFEMNTKGKDFVVGDIHGCFSKLQEQLWTIGFNEEVDRLFCVGDLIDRGPESYKFEEWLDYPWFNSVRGNHEELLWTAIEGGEQSNASACHYMNGGSWLYGLPLVEQQFYAILCKELPLAIEIDTPNGLVGIIHAECPFGDWNKFKEALGQPQDEWNKLDAIALWARTKISSKDESVVKGLHKLYVGHTPVDDIVQLGNVEYIDTGAVFKGGKFSIVQIN